MIGVKCEVGLAEDSRSENNISVDFRDNRESQKYKYKTSE